MVAVMEKAAVIVKIVVKTVTIISQIKQIPQLFKNSTQIKDTACSATSKQANPSSYTLIKTQLTSNL
jgi:competence protein ComGC